MLSSTSFKVSCIELSGRGVANSPVKYRKVASANHQRREGRRVSVPGVSGWNVATVIRWCYIEQEMDVDVSLSSSTNCLC